MGTLAALWLPIVVSAVLVFFSSSIIWMALPIHRKDYRGLPDEASVVDAVRRQSPPPGVYMFPWCQGHGSKPSPEERAAMEAKMKAGPWGVLVIMGGSFSFGKTLGLWFVHLLVASFLVAYVASAALPPGTPYLQVFRIAGAAAFLVYAGGLAPRCIWEGKPWSQFPAALFDAIVYTLLTAGVFGWLWPKA